MEQTKKTWAVLCGALVCIAGVTFLGGTVGGIPVRGLRIAALVGCNLLNGAIALVAMRLTGRRFRADFGHARAYGIGAALAVGLSLVIAVIPALCGVSLVGGEHTEFTWFRLIYSLLFYLLVIGPVEELVFRVYLQDTLAAAFGKHPWVGVVVAAFLFGLWHLINGGLLQVLFTFGIGLVFGFAKYRIRDCGYVGVAFGHGLYDFLNVIVTMTLV